MTTTGSSRQATNDIFRLINSGQIEQAKKTCRILLDQNPNDINILGLLGAILLKLGQPQKAKPVLEKTIQLEPDFAKPYEDLGMLYLQSDDASKAVEYFENAVRLDATQASAYRGLAKALSRIGKNEAATAAQEKYLALSPVAQGLSKANALLAAGQTTDAQAVCEEIATQHPTDTKVLRLLARIASEDGRHVVAEGLLKRIIKLSESNYRAYVDLALYLGERSRYPEAVEVLEQAVALEPTIVSIRQSLGDYLAIIGRSADALDVYNSALEIDPKLTTAMIGRGHMLRVFGRKQDAIAAYESAISINPEFGDGWWSLASLRSYRFSTEQVDAMRKQLELADGNVRSKISFHFALARAAEESADFDTAWQNYEQGNSLKRSGVQYDPVRNETSHDDMVSFFSSDYLQTNRSDAGDGPTPIFIVGMPRSGSTLIEQILASHSQVEGAAELPYMQLLSDSLASPHANGKKYPSVLEDKSADQIASIGKSYTYYAQSDLSQKLPFFTDKMPANFEHIGLIHIALPRAKIIDVRRHPLDTCIGNYRQLFAGGKNHAYDLNECAEYYLEYVRMMDHWNDVLPGRVLQVQYEDIVADVEGQTRRILEYCELAWEDACLKFYETNRAVNTASAEQVREPVYSDAVGYWKNYEAHLDDVKIILESTLSEHSQK